MRIYLAAAILIGALAGCSSDPGPSAEASAAAAHAPKAQAALPFSARATTSAFASLPDHGELLAYEYARPVKHHGAYTAYPVGISEAHALRAMQTGEMTVKAPNGELIRLKYERHVESPDGNWTWIGRNAEGADAVITFGEKAVFGSIPQGADNTLRLTMSAGQSWLVQTERSKLAGLDGIKDGQRTDQLVPPKLAADLMQRQAASAGATPVTGNAAASTAVIDVLLGYTNGYASQIGSASAAVTRLNNLVAIINQAYANSGISMRVRLVKTLQVTYPDNTSNADALEELTGYEAGSGGGPTDPNPAFDELREARDDSGADLVSLVRAFRTPENEGCGIAWLIGGDQSGINTGDAPFGYSVISDGTDEDEDDGNDYYCRDETLAHELGHNMGQAHDEEDSDSSGVHAYSYGYRESSSTGFYTVMAYPKEDGSQFGIRYFANPSVKYDGRKTGVSDASDNVRSMAQTMPIVAMFRSTVVPLANIRNDFDGDGRSDALWRNFSDGRDVYWNGAKQSEREVLGTVDDLNWIVSGVGDFSGDGKADILWRNKRDDRVVLWPDADRSKRATLKDVSYSKWKTAGVGDFNGDGRDDILWRSTTTGQNVYWSAANASSRVELYTLTSQRWVVAGVGNFNGDSRDDILWRNTSDGTNVYWNGGLHAQRQELYTVDDQAWKVAGVGDFDGNGKSDILWRNPDGRNVYWPAAARGDRVELASTSNQWSVVQVADFNGDGLSDIFWRNSNGNNVYWSAGKQSGRKVLESVAGSWRIVP